MVSNNINELMEHLKDEINLALDKLGNDILKELINKEGDLFNTFCLTLKENKKCGFDNKIEICHFCINNACYKLGM